MQDARETIDTAHETALVAVPQKVWPLVLGSLLMAGLCGAVLWPLFREPNAFERAVLWIGLVFFGGGGALVSLQGLDIIRPVITLSPQGFTATRVASEVVPWSAVLGVRTWSYAGSTLIVVKITDEAWRGAGISLTARLTRAANRWLGIDGLAISVMGMPISTKDIVKLFRTYAREHRRSQKHNSRS